MDTSASLRDAEMFKRVSPAWSKFERLVNGQILEKGRMIKDNCDHPGFIVRIQKEFFLFDNEEEMGVVLKRKGLNPKHITEGARCLYNWNHGQCEIKCSNCTITLCEMLDTGKERVAHNIIVRQEANNLGW